MCKGFLHFCRFATIGYILPEYWRFPGYLSKFLDLRRGIILLLPSDFALPFDSHARNLQMCASLIPFVVLQITPPMILPKNLIGSGSHRKCTSRTVYWGHQICRSSQWFVCFLQSSSTGMVADCGLRRHRGAQCNLVQHSGLIGWKDTSLGRCVNGLCGSKVNMWSLSAVVAFAPANNVKLMLLNYLSARHLVCGSYSFVCFHFSICQSCSNRPRSTTSKLTTSLATMVQVSLAWGRRDRSGQWWNTMTYINFLSFPLSSKFDIYLNSSYT